ncbi:hypothetical protein Vadar_031440 [Vaccinium darrowii]|uniref:Uncharacterized protein n=1 Tax=Vaccinium darrowii TaxID=229202 RepID=A0ACB7X5A2_9ERIC|nr:hypothetical protein Vadar_031440 [Vaccinium darrowii]
MMDCNKEEAIRAKQIAENKMQNKDFSGARKIAIKVQQLYPDLENISQMIMVCDVHCASEHKVCGDDYGSPAKRTPLMAAVVSAVVSSLAVLIGASERREGYGVAEKGTHIGR